jgi:hypothetical protein
MMMRGNLRQWLNCILFRSPAERRRRAGKRIQTEPLESRLLLAAEFNLVRDINLKLNSSQFESQPVYNRRFDGVLRCDHRKSWDGVMEKQWNFRRHSSGEGHFPVEWQQLHRTSWSTSTARCTSPLTMVSMDVSFGRPTVLRPEP